MGKTKFQQSWKNDRPWLTSIKNDHYSAKCTACGDVLNIVSGVGAVKNHEKTPKHLRNISTNKNQLQFVVKKGTVAMQSSDKVILLTSEERKWNAEILRALTVVDKNYAFQSCKSDNNIYRRMFPDSEIAKNYEMSATKVMYIIRHGIAIYVRNDLKKEIDDRPFTFHFDESTTEQVKKQYDGYATFFSTSQQQVTTAYFGTLFVGRCSSEDMITHFHDFFKEKSLNVKYLLNLGMDGPNVNIAFKNLLIDDLINNHETKFIYLGTCALHTVNNAFGKLVKTLSEIVDLDQMAIDFHFFFKYSAGRREDFEKVSEITGVLTQHLNKHCTSRWISLDRVLVKLIEQFNNLKEYFLTSLPKLLGFNGKTGIASTARYKRIKGYLLDENVLILMHFVVSVAQEFQSFMKPLQKTEPMIHVLHPKCMHLLHMLLLRFMKPETFLKANKLIGVNEMVELCVSNEANHRVRFFSCIFSPFSLRVTSKIQFLC